VLIRITGNTAEGTDRWKYSAEQLKEQKTTVGYETWELNDNAKTWTNTVYNFADDANEIGGRQAIQNGRIFQAQVFFIPDGSGGFTEEVWFDGVNGEDATFAVNVTQTGGSAGNKTTQCSFTYTVSDLNGNTLGTAVNPTTSPHTYKRIAKGITTAATAGIACWVTVSGTPTLSVRWVNEVPGAEACP